MDAAAPVPDYAPVPLHDQVQELKAQIAIHLKFSAKWVSRHRMSEVHAAIQLQRLQSALRSLQALELLLGSDAAFKTDDLMKRLAVIPQEIA